MVLNIFDLLLAPIYLLIIYFIAGYIQKKNIGKNPLYKWYTKGLFAKIGGAIALCLIYQFYYVGGDTVNYFLTSKAISNLMWKDIEAFADMMLNGDSVEVRSSFDMNTGYPEFSGKVEIYVSRLLVPLVLLGAHSFIATAISLAWLCYTGVWRLFLLFNQQFPSIEKKLSISILFIPSVVFWGSGLLKDTIALSAIGWYTYYFYSFFVQKRYSFSGATCILVASFLLISIKGYILFALIPGSIVWLSNERLKKVKNKIIRVVLGPFFIFGGIAFGIFILTQMGDMLGVYAIDKVLEKAVVSNIDQKQEYYGGNSFDIGDFDPSVQGVLGKAHLAISATLFRPFLWEARNPVMVLSGLENTYILLLTSLLLIKLKFLNFFVFISKEPLVLFSMLFALFFAFSVGLATSNFGSLVRLKVPCIPFFVSSLFVVKHLYEKKYKKKLKI
ncbi:MAG: hypothetical protein ACT4ON_01265 [Bacteroidota bacterium]